jgi:hypothetical protein|nr:MAG TPA: hypothetical protein [Herelleviridae sp.]DAQ59498.1 MAG TPA: hypothetical protein [Caudoviricetes sp.]
MDSVITKDKVTYIDTEWLKKLHSFSSVSKFFIKSTQFTKKGEKKKIRELKDSRDYVRVSVSDADSEFINILGLSVNVLNGDIALGLNITSDYIVIGNISSVIKSSFKVKNLPEYFNINMFLTMVKFNIEMLENSIVTVLRDMYESTLPDSQSNSIVYAIVRKKSELSDIDDFITDVMDMISYGYNPVRGFIDSCVSLSCKLQSQAVLFYGSFIENISSDDIVNTYQYVIKNRDSIDWSDIIKTSKPNLDLLTLYYISEGVPVAYLIALLSYGFLIKQRKIEYASKPNVNKEIEYSRFLHRVANSIQSNNYSRDSVKTIVYNIIDVFICKGKFNLLQYAIENDKISIVEYLLKSLNVDWVLSDNTISVDWFSAIVVDYIKNICPLVYNGSMYRKTMLSRQKDFVRVSIPKLYHVGKLVDDISYPLLGLFK